MEKGQAGQVSSRDLIRSKQRVADHGEVFTPSWLVDAMLNLVKSETSRIESRFLEPACGTGNFLVRVLQRKFAAVQLRFGKSDFDRRHYALLAVMSSYGIELLKDNITECRAKMLDVFADFLAVRVADDFARAASYVLSLNVVQGDALEMCTSRDEPIAFSEWEYLGKGQFQRRDFRLDALVQSSRFSAKGALFAGHEVLRPMRTYPPMSVRELARAAVGRGPRGNA